MCLLRVPSKVALEGCIAGPAEHRAADGAPGGDDDVDAAVGVRVAFSSAVVVVVVEVRILPDDEGFVETVKVATGVVLAVSAVREGLLVAV